MEVCQALIDVLAGADMRYLIAVNTREGYAEIPSGGVLIIPAADHDLL